MMEARENKKVMLKNIHLWRLLMKKDRKACHRYAKINWDTIYKLEKRVAKEKCYVSCFFVDEEYEKV